MKKALAALALLVASQALAYPFSITITNTATAGPGWSTGLITLQPLIAIGLVPQPSNPMYATYAFLDSNCNVHDTLCSGACIDDGNATLLAQRWGLTLGVNAWLVPALALGGNATVTIDAPAGSRVSYVSWLNSTAVFDDFISLHEVGKPSVLSAPLFDGSGNPLTSVPFELRGYDVNSLSATDGSGGTCTAQCPGSINPACYVAQGNASYGSTGALPVPAPQPIKSFVALSGNARNSLTWTNPIPSYGVVILRRISSAVNSVPTGNPTVGTAFGTGNAAQRSVVVYNGTNTNSFVDTFTNATYPLTNGQTYYYKVFSKNVNNVYASGDVPSSAGIFSIPTSGALPNPRWCYSFGLASVLQPVLPLTTGVLSSSNSGAITGNNPDGSEMFRPVTVGTSGTAVQGRFLALPLAGRTGTFVIAGDQAGNVTVINGQSGTVVWTRNVATHVQAQPAAQLYAYSNAAFQAANPGRDLIFIASRNSSASTNTVTALSSVDGSQVWQFKPNDLADINGGMLLDRTNNRLWVATGSGGGASVRVLNSLNGALVQSFTNAGAVILPISWGYGTNEAIVTNTSGAVFAYTLDTMLSTWTHAPGPQSNYAFPTNDGYIATLSSGRVQRYTVNPTTKVVTPVWAPDAGVAVTGPTGVRIDYTTQKAYVGGNNGVLSQLNVATGGVEKTVTVATGQALGAPMLDPLLTPPRLYVSVLDGRLCSYDTPF